MGASSRAAASARRSPKTPGATSRTVTADADNSTASAEECIVATRQTTTSDARGAGTKASTARGNVDTAGPAGSSARAESAIAATAAPKRTFENAAATAAR